MPISNANIAPSAIIRYPELVNIYGCSIGAESQVGPFVEIQSQVTIGPRCKIQSHAFICSGVTLEEGVFVGHGVMFVNDRYPQAQNSQGQLETAGDWKLEPTLIERGATLGSNCTIMGGVTVGAGALVGAGAVVTADVPPNCVVAGVPARLISRDCTADREHSRRS